MYSVTECARMMSVLAVASDDYRLCYTYCTARITVAPFRTARTSDT
jgi:hypothetical protein